MNTKLILTFIVLVCLSALVSECKKVKKTETVISTQEEAPLIHDYLKLAFWFVTGVIVGVYFQAKLSFKTLVSPVLRYAVSGFLLAVSIFVMFQFATFVNNYL